MENRLLRVEDAAERLSLSPRRASELIRAGLLPSVKVGRFVRVPSSALDAYLASKADEALASVRSAQAQRPEPGK